jgi:hypothetical protein
MTEPIEVESFDIVKLQEKVELVKQNYQNSTSLSFDTLPFMERMDLLVKSKLVPFNTAAAAAIAVQFANDLQLPPTLGCTLINVISGKPSLNAFGISALIKAKKHFFALTKDCEPCEVLGKKDIVTEITAMRADEKMLDDNGRPIKHIVRYYYSEAQAAGLATKDNWKKHTRDMMYARCISRMGRQVYPDVVTGCYLPDELEDKHNIVYDGEGNIIKQL